MCDSGTRPAFIPVPNTVRVNFNYELEAQQVENVWYFEGAAPFDSGDCIDLANVLAGEWISHIMPEQPNALKLNTIEVTALDAATAPYALKNVSTFGAGASPILPANVTLSVKFSGGLTGRSQRGRTYWLQLSEVDVVGNSVLTGKLGAILGALSAFFDAVNGSVNDCQHVVVSYCNGGAWRTTGATTPVTSYTSDGLIDSQRRRLTGRGR